MKPRPVLLASWMLWAGVSLSVQGQELPKTHTLHSAPVTYHADFHLPKDSALFRELRELRDQVYRELKLPKGEKPIQVYLFNERNTYEKFITNKYPLLPMRRAIFVAQSGRFNGRDELMVFSYWSSLVQEDLRHELTHAFLHSVLKDVPLWLDEGLASYYELPSTKKHVNATHLEKLVRPKQGQPKPNLVRLEKLGELQQMTSAEYREAWAWVHLLMRGDQRPKDIFLEYLQELRTKSGGDSLHKRLQPAIHSLNEALDRHLADLDAENKARSKDR